MYKIVNINPRYDTWKTIYEQFLVLLHLLQYESQQKSHKMYNITEKLINTNKNQS